MSAIFISHSSRDNVIADELKVRLKEQGHRSVFLDFDPAIGIPSGCNWEQELYQQLRSCQAFIVLCSKDSMASKWCFAEIAYAKGLGKHIFPIKIGDCVIDTVLTSYQVIDLTVNKEVAYQRLWSGLKVAGLDPASSFDWDGSRTPYPGLIAFQEEDAAVFFGRDSEIQQGLELLNRLRQFGGARMVLVLGASGSGKSSLVRAGLLPRMRKNRDQWLIIDPFRPQENPLQQLVIVLTAAFAKYGKDRDRQDVCNTSQQAGISQSLNGNILNEMMKKLRILANQREASVLLVIDQTEELFSLTDAEIRGRFLSLLRAALDAPNSPLMVIFILRSDFLGNFQQHPVVRGMVSEDLKIGAMSVDGIVHVIEGPAAVAGVELEPGLVQTMVKDTGAEDALPLLAFTLREFYEHYTGDGRLTVEGYRDKLGGLAGSISKAAETVFEAKPLTDDQQKDFRKSLLSMVRIDEEGKFVRRKVRWTELPERIHPLLERFVQARLLVSGGEGKDRFLEVAHEALFRSWGRLRGWLDEDREFLLWRKRLNERLDEWRERGQDEGSLLRGASLVEAQRWLKERNEDMSLDERKYIQAGLESDKKERENQEKRKRNIIKGLAVFSIITLTLAGFSGLQWQKAEEQRDSAVSRQLAFQSEMVRDHSLNLAVLLAIESLNKKETPAGNQALLKGFELLPYQITRIEHNMIDAVAFSPDGKYLATAGWDNTTRVWNATTGTELARIENDNAVLAVTFSPDGKYLATASNDNTARVWDVATGRELAKMIHDGRVDAIAFSPDGRYLATASWDNTARIWETTTAKEHTKMMHGDYITAVTFSSDGKYLATASNDNTARVWDAATGTELAKMEHDSDVLAVTFSPDGKYLATASGDNIARVWDAATGTELAKMVHGNYVWAVTFSPDGKYLATASWDNTARVWDAATSTELAKMVHDNAVLAVAFSPDGKYLATASGDNTARIWDAATGRELAKMVHGNRVATVTFSPDGKYLATASWDNTARVWETATAKELVIMEHDYYVTAVTFSPDGKYLATASSDKTARVWLLKLENMVGEACSRLTRNLTPEEWQMYIGDQPYRKSCPELP